MSGGVSSPIRLGGSPSQVRPGALLGRSPAHAALIQAVDSFPETNGAGIMLVEEGGRRTEVRGGPRRKWVWIAPKGMVAGPLTDMPGETPVPAGWWDRWGGVVLNCGSTAATGVVIGLTGGIGSFGAGFFAVNSAALCMSSLGKAMAQDVWQELEREGGTGYKIWLTVETAMGLIDLCNGVKGAMGFLRTWRQTGKLARLQKVVAGKKLTRKNLLELIRQIDAGDAALIEVKSAKYVSRTKLLGVGDLLLKKARFVSLANHRARAIVETFGNALSLPGAPDNAESTFKTSLVLRKQWDAWFVQFES